MNLIYSTIVMKSQECEEVKVEQWIKNPLDTSDREGVSRKKVKER